MAVLDNYRMEEVLHDLQIPAKILLQDTSVGDEYVPLHWHKHIEINLMLQGRYGSDGNTYLRVTEASDGAKRRDRSDAVDAFSGRTEQAEEMLQTKSNFENNG